jgi:ankyrin repeat protein
VRELCGAGAELEAVSLPSGRTPLLVAMLNWHESTVAALLDEGASLSATCANGYTPIMLAVKQHNAEGEDMGEEAVGVRLCAVLCAAGGSVNAARLQGPHPDGCTALMFASQDGRLDIVHELLRQGASVDAKRVDNDLTALYFAAQEGHAGTVEALLAAGASASVAAPDGFSALMAAAQRGHLSIARVLIAAGANVNARRRALQAGGAAGAADAAFFGDTALHLAAFPGHADVVRELCSAGAELEAVSLPSGCTPLLVAMEHWHEAAVAALLQAGASSNVTCANGLTPIMLAAMPHGVEGEGEPVAVRLCVALCDAGGDVNAARLRGAQPDGCTALMFACEWGRLAIARVLLSRGARVNAKRIDNGLTALFFAAYKGRASTVEMLLAAGACPSVAARQNGLTALMVAAQRSTAVTRLLLQAGADFRARDATGRMAPHYAATSGCRATLALFVGLSF